MSSILKTLVGAAVGFTMLTALPGIAARADDSAWAGSDAYAEYITGLHSEAAAAGQREVIIYGGYSAMFEPLWGLFSERFPDVQVVPNPLSGPALVTRLDAEFTSGQVAGDILMAGMTELLSNVDKGRAAAFRPDNADTLAKRYVDPDGRFVIQFADVYGILYNTTRMSADQVPQKPADLANPALKDLILDDPLAGGVATLCWIELYNSDLLDGPTMRAIRDNATVVPSLTPYYANLTTGSIPMLAWGSFTRYQNLKASSAPVAFEAVPGMVVPLYGGTAMLDGGPNPEAAKLLQAWFVTPEAQQALITLANAYPLLPGMETPADWPALQPMIDALAVIDPADYMKVRSGFELAVKAAMQ